MERLCAQCGTTFEQVGRMGAPRKFCYVCRPTGRPLSRRPAGQPAAAPETVVVPLEEYRALRVAADENHLLRVTLASVRALVNGKAF